jgi:hypothetical protein
VIIRQFTAKYGSFYVATLYPWHTLLPLCWWVPTKYCHSSGQKGELGALTEHKIVETLNDNNYDTDSMHEQSPGS